MVELDKCVKCGTRENMTFYTLKSKRTDIPACNTCKIEFHNFDQAKNCYKILIFGLGVNLIFLLLNLWYAFWRLEWYRNLWIPCGIVGGILLVIAIVWRISIFRHPNHKVSNVKKYVKVKYKDKKSVWYNKWQIIIFVLSLLITFVGILLNDIALIVFGLVIFVPTGMIFLLILGKQKKFYVVRQVRLKKKDQKEEKSDSWKERIT